MFKQIIKTFLGFHVLFYLLWAMFHDESSDPSPITFEIAVVMVAVAMLCNLGFFLFLGKERLKVKNFIIPLILVAAFFNFFMFVSITHNPFRSLEIAQWNVLQKIFAYTSVLFSLVTSILVLRHKK